MLRLRKALLLSPGQLLLPDQDAEYTSTLLKSWVLSKGTRRTESWEMVDGTFGVWRLAFVSFVVHALFSVLSFIPSSAPSFVPSSIRGYGHLAL